MYSRNKTPIALSLLLLAAFFANPIEIKQTHAQTSSTNNTRKISNAIKYSDKGAKLATGRAGSATISVRALMNKRMSESEPAYTDLEVTTGELDSLATPPGTLSKVQIKSFDMNDGLRYVRNYSNLNNGGSFRLTMPDVFHYQPLQVQANIRGIDGNRTGVVTVLTDVRLRPDLEAKDLSAPSHALVNQPVIIGVTLIERNLDVGARANVVLYVDGTEADRADDIWVDAAGVVSTAFTKQFSSVGTKQIEVKVETVKPGDFDTSNNSVTGSIEIKQPASRFRYYSLWGSDYTFHDSGRNQGFYRYDPSGPYNQNGDWDYEWSNTGRTQSAHFWAWSPEYAPFPFNLSVDERSDGAVVKSSVLLDVAQQGGNSHSNGVITDRWAWFERFDAVGNAYIYIQNYEQIENATGVTLSAQTYIQYNRNAGDVTYFSRGYERNFGNNGDGSPFFWSWNYDNAGRNVYGNLTTFGADYGFNVTLTGGDETTFTLSAIRSTTPYNNTGQQPFMCFPFDHSRDYGFPYYGQHCSERNYSYNGKQFSGGDWQDIVP